MKIHLQFNLSKYIRTNHHRGDLTYTTAHVLYTQPLQFDLDYALFFRFEDAYDKISRILNYLRIGDQARIIDSTITQAREMIINSDEISNYVIWNLRSFEEREVDIGMVPAAQDNDDDIGMVPAALKAIRSLETKTIKVKDGSKDVEQCMVCLEEFPHGENVTCMPCSHLFHKDCITKWLARSHMCPICRYEMPK